MIGLYVQGSRSMTYSILPSSDWLLPPEMSLNMCITAAIAERGLLPCTIEHDHDTTQLEAWNGTSCPQGSEPGPVDVRIR